MVRIPSLRNENATELNELNEKELAGEHLERPIEQADRNKLIEQEEEASLVWASSLMIE